MPKRASLHPLALLRRILEIPRKLLAAELFPGTAGDLLGKRDRLVGDCERGKYFLKNQTSALRRIVMTFGARPDGFTTHTSVDAKGLSGGDFTLLWFFAWTFTGLEPAPVNPPIEERLTLARRIHRANQLHGAYLRHHDPFVTGIAAYEFGQNDEEEPINYRRFLPIEQKDKPFEDRVRLSRKLLEEISGELKPPEYDNRRWLFDLNALTHAYQLLPVFHALEER